MGLFAAYLDAAGDWKNQPFVVVAGYIANSTQWRVFDNTWKTIHDDFRLDLPFHMSDFASAITNEKYKLQTNARRDYVEIAQDPIRWGGFLTNLLIAQVTMANCAVCCVVPMDIYNQIDSVVELRELIPPYALGARYCVERIHRWEKEFEIEEPVEIVFEGGDFGQGEFSKLMVGEGMPIPTYKNKKDFAGLQGADHYAWEITNRKKQLDKNMKFEPRPEMVYLLHQIPRLHIEPTQESLINICHERGIKARAWKK